MGTFKDYLISKGYSVETTKSYDRALLRYITWADGQGIEAELGSYNEVVGYIQHLRNKGLQQQTIQQAMNSIGHYFKWTVKRGLRTDDPTTNIDIKGIKRRKLHNILNKQELEKLYHDFKNIESESPAKKRNEIIVGLLVYQGLNSKELGRLKATDLKLREGRVNVERSRTSNARSLKLEAHQILDMMEYQLRTREEILKSTGKEIELLFTSFGNSTRFGNIMYKLLPQLKKLNRNIESVNQIRTSVITAWLKTHNLREVQYMAGHRYISSTEAYLANDIDGLQEEIEKYHPIG